MSSNNRHSRIAGFLGPRAALFLCGLLSAAAWADITIEGTQSPGFSGGVDRQVVYLREDQMRVDQLASDSASTDSALSSLLIRFSGRPAGLLYLDHGSKIVEILSALPSTGTANATVDPAANPVYVVRRDDPRQILGHTAQRYDFSFSGNVDPLVLLGEQLPPGMESMFSIRLNVSGTSWVVPGMDGAEELASFFAALAGKQLAVGMLGQDPSLAGQRGSVVSPGLSRALTEVMAQITRKGFPLLLQTRSDMNVDAEGFVADMIQAMLEEMGVGGPQSTESIVTRVNTATVKPELFYADGLPPGYTLNEPAEAAGY